MDQIEREPASPSDANGNPWPEDSTRLADLLARRFSCRAYSDKPVPRETIEQLLRCTVHVRDDGSVRAPGTLESHYAPRTRVEVVDVADLRARAATLSACARVGVIAPELPADLPPAVVVVGVPVDADDYAHSLYRLFRVADDERLDVVLAVPPPGTGLGAAVADRLRRAAGSAI